MSFRKEEKLKVDKNQTLSLINWINQNKGIKLFDTRVISSTYFDNSSLDMYKDSEEGCVPRKKIRIRSYTSKPHTLTPSLLETKISSVEGRFKTSKKMRGVSKALRFGILDQNYGICKAKVRITYKRSYYKIHNVRLTIDKNIQYIKIINSQESIKRIKEPDIAVEIKADNSVPSEYINKMFPFERLRFSKYSKAINAIL